jgi:imidazolonepropionase-like amidohydrolase
MTSGESTEKKETRMAGKLRLFLSLFAAVTAAVAVGWPGISDAIAEGEEAPKHILIRNVNIFDGKSDELKKGIDVLVEGNLIKDIGKDLRAGAEATVIDGGGRTLMPGMIDSHVHFTHTYARGGLAGFEAMTWDEIGAIATVAAREWLMDGFTTVRDMGGMGTGLKRVIDRGLLPGPRIYAAGAYISQTSGHADTRLRSQPNPQMFGTHNNLSRLGIFRLADGVPNVLMTVRENLAEGSAYIKIMAGGGFSTDKDPLHTIQYRPEEIRAAVEAAADWDTYVAVHVYYPAGIIRALEAGVKCIDHGQFINDETMKVLVEKGAFLSPNMAGLSPEIFMHPVYGKLGSPQRIKTEQYQRDAGDFVRLVKKYKPKRVFNSDTVFATVEGARKVRDFEKFVGANWFGNLEALKALTSRPGQLAALTGKNNPYPEGKLGVIEEGAYADILLVDDNPLEDITVIGGNPKWFSAEPRGEGIETIRLIMKDGRIYKNTL